MSLMNQSNQLQVKSTVLPCQKAMLQSAKSNSIRVEKTDVELLTELFPEKNRPIFSEQEVRGVHVEGSHHHAGQPETVLDALWSQLCQKVSGVTRQARELLPPYSSSLSECLKTNDDTVDVFDEGEKKSGASALGSSVALKQASMMSALPESFRKKSHEEGSFLKQSAKYSKKYSTGAELRSFIERENVMNQVVRDASRTPSRGLKPVVHQSLTNQMMNTPTARSVDADQTKRLLERNKFLSNSINHLVDGYFQSQDT